MKPPHSEEAQMLLRAKRAVLDSTEWLSASEVGSLCGTDSLDLVTEWREEGKIFSIPHNGSELVPRYALDKNASYHPLGAMVEALKAFRSVKDDWGIAFWFASANSYLGGQRPQDVLESHPDQVIAAAYDELRGVTHG